MSRIAECFEGLRKDNRAGLIPFVVAGDPEPRFTLPIMRTLADAGSDIIELGMPFSDPMADGPVIQAGSERALRHGVSLRDILAMVKEFRAENTRVPVVLMGYANAVERIGYAHFSEALAQAGADGVVLVDLPPEEAAPLRAELAKAGIALIFLVAPTTSAARMEYIASMASGFLYYVSVKGVTGSSALKVEPVRRAVDDLRRHTDLPVVVGFGIRDSADAAGIAAISDAVVIGSAVVELVGQLRDVTPEALAGVRDYLGDVRRVTESVARNGGQ